MGDFNINWDDKTIRKNLKQITDHFDLKQMINEPTRIIYSTRSQIDYIFSNRAERILNTFNMLFNSVIRKYDSYGITKCKLDDFRKAVHQIEWDDLLIGKDQDEDCQTFSKKIESTITDLSCKLNPKNKKHTVPWMKFRYLRTNEKTGSCFKNCKQIKV